EVVPEEHRHHARQVEALFSAGQPATEVQVVDLVRVELGYLRQRRADHGRGEVVGPQVGEGALDGAADRGAGGGGDDSFRHGARLPRGSYRDSTTVSSLTC